MWRTTSKIAKPDTRNDDFETPLGAHVPSICSQRDVFLRPGTPNLPVGVSFGWIGVPYG